MKWGFNFTTQTGLLTKIRISLKKIKLLKVLEFDLLLFWPVISQYIHKDSNSGKLKEN